MSDIRFLTAPGSRFTLIGKPGQAYPGISWADIARLVANPQAKEKQDADFFIPSTYREHDGRSHDAQREYGAYRMLALDIDRGNPSLDDVLAAVEAVCGPVSLLAYSSSGATPENRKWRVLIPVMGVLTGAEYELAQTALFDLLHANGIHPDGALARCGQPIYLPNVPLDKRNPDLSPIFYVMRVIRAKTLRIDDSPIRQEIDRRLEQYRLAAEQAQIASRERERQRAERRQKFPDQVSPVDAFNADHDIEDLFARYQYERRGSSRHYRSRYQTSPSFATQNFLSHWVSLSGSDAAAGVGKSKSLGENSYCWGDAFDLFVHYEHDGDFDKAVRAYGLEISPAKSEIELPENGMDDFDYVAPQAAQEAPASAQADDIHLDSFDTPDAPEAAPDWPTLYDMFDGASIEPRRWIYGNHYLRSFVSVLASAGGIGKTSLQIVEALAIVTGRPLLGEEVKERTNVWIVNLEDPLEEIQRRVIAAMQHYKITPEEVRGRLFVNAGRDFSLKFGIQTRDGVLPNTKLVEYLCKQIPQKQIGCVFIDPFVGAHSINENDNMAVNAIVAEIRRVADETKSAIGLVHHIRKGNGEDASIDSVRGAGSLIGAARAARVVNKVSEDDAMKLGVDVEKAKGIFRVDDGKANLSPPADKSTYRQMIGVKIDNGEWIGVCVPFDLPDEWKGMTDAVVNEMLRMIELGPRTEDGSQEYYSIRPQDKDRFVGRVVTTFAFDDPKHMKNDGQAKRIIKTWHEKGLIEEFEYRSESQRKDRKGVRPVGRVGEQF
jgi:RecA-family ATPase